MSKVAPYAKALVGAVVAALGVLAGYLVNDTGLSDITAGQWVGVAIAFFVALGAIFATPNAPAPQ